METTSISPFLISYAIAGIFAVILFAVGMAVIYLSRSKK